MKATRKPLTDEVWCNLAPDEKGYERMPLWVASVTEESAVEGKTFMIRGNAYHAPRICRVGWWVIKGPTDVYAIPPESFVASYEPIPESKGETA